MGYKRLLIQKGSDAVRDTAAFWGIYASKTPYIPFPPKPKNAEEQEWKDQNGKERFFPTTPRYNSAEFKVQFVIKGSRAIVKSRIKDFCTYISNSYISIYDEHTGIGRQKVVFTGYDENNYGFEIDGETIVVNFLANFECDDVLTDITLTI